MQKKQVLQSFWQEADFVLSLRIGAGSAVAIGLLAWCEELFLTSLHLPLLMGSLGASAVLLFATPYSPLAQPRNVIGGHVLSAAVGVGTQLVLGAHPIMAACCAVSLAIIMMRLSHTLHPPGGATALIAVIGGDGVHALGWEYVLAPCALGAVCMVCVAFVVNNLASRQRWPLAWL